MSNFKLKVKLNDFLHPMRYLDKIAKINEIKAAKRLSNLKLITPSGRVNYRLINIISSNV